MVARGIRPMTAEITIKKYRYNVKQWRPMPAIKKLAKKLRRQETKQLYVINRSSLEAATTIPWQRNNLASLLEFNSDKKAGLSRWNFLSNAMYRLEKGQHCFTWTGNDRLLSCIWVSFGEESITIENHYCHASAKEWLPAFLKNMVIALAENKEDGTIQLKAADRQLFRAMKVAGFNAATV